MEVLIDSDVLLEGLSKVKPIVGSKGLVPILNCFILEAEEGKFSISASSDDMTMRWSIGEDAEYVEKQKQKVDPSSIEDSSEGEEGSEVIRKNVLKVLKTGEAPILASRLYEIVNKLGGSYKVNLSLTEDENLVISCDTIDAKATLTRDIAADIEDFNKISLPSAKEIQLPEDFTSMLKLAQIAMCEIESRFDLKGLHIKISDGKIFLSSCDNKKICRVFADISDNEVEGSFFISREAVKELIRMKPTSFYAGPKNHLTFKNLTSLFSIQLLEDRFPELDKFIDMVNEGEFFIEVDRRQLKDAIDWVSILSETLDKRIDFDIADGSLLLYSELNKSKQKRRIKAETPVELEFGCNPDYFTEYLNVVEDKTVKFFMHDQIKKIFFKRSNVIYIVTPKK